MYVLKVSMVFCFALDILNYTAQKLQEACFIFVTYICVTEIYFNASFLPGTFTSFSPKAEKKSSAVSYKDQATS